MLENKIVLITPPDKIFNQNNSVLLVFPSDAIKEQAQEILAKSTDGQNIYVYSPTKKEDEDIDWLLTVSKMVNVVVLDCDNLSEHTKMFSSYLISLPHTYWLTSDDWMLYNKLSPNRIYGLDIIEDLIGGHFDTQQ